MEPTLLLSRFICSDTLMSKCFGSTIEAHAEKGVGFQRFELALSQIAGKRLTFAEVTGKVGQASFSAYWLKRGKRKH